MGIKEVILESFSSGGWVRYNKTIARELGLEASICLGNLIDKHSYWVNRGNDEFFHAREDIEFETALTPHQQRKGEKALFASNLITVKAKAHPTKLRRINWYTIDYVAIAAFLAENAKVLQRKNESTRSLKSSTTGDQKFQPLVVENFDGNKNKGNKIKANKNFNNIPSIAWSDEPTCNDKVDSLDTESTASVIESAQDLKYNASGIDTSAPFKESTALNIETAASVNSVPALEYEEEADSDYDLPVDAPALKDNIKCFLFHHALLRDEQNLPAVRYDGHVDRLAEVPNYVLETYLDSDGNLMRKFYNYCDDRSYDMDVRHYECNSDRSPSVMVNESVFRRFMDWKEL